MSHAAIDTTVQTPLRPLDRRRVASGFVPAQAPAQSVTIRRPPAEAPKEDVSSLAQSAFISRSYELQNTATMVGPGLDGVIRGFSAVANDVEGLSRPGMTVGTGVALGGKLIKDATGLVVGTGRVMDGLNRANARIMRSSGDLKHLSAAVNGTFNTVNKTLQPVLTRVERVGAIGSLGMATIALPSLATSAVQRNRALIQTLANDKATKGQRIEAIKDASYTNAALAYTAMAIPKAINTLATTHVGSSAVTRLAQRAQGTKTYATANRMGDVITPLADATLLVADGLHLYTTMTSPSAKGKAKARAALNVGLDALKLSLYACPRTRGVQVAYTAAGVTQLGFAIHSLIRPDDE